MTVDTWFEFWINNIVATWHPIPGEITGNDTSITFSLYSVKCVWWM